MKKLIVLLLAAAILLTACSSSPADKIDPDYYQAGKDALGIAQAYLADRITLSEAKEKAKELEKTLDALRLIPEKDPMFEQSDIVKLYANSVCLHLAMQTSETRTLQLHEDLEKYAARLEELLGLK